MIEWLNASRVRWGLKVSVRMQVACLVVFSSTNRLKDRKEGEVLTINVVIKIFK